VIRVLWCTGAPPRHAPRAPPREDRWRSPEKIAGAVALVPAVKREAEEDWGN
jgi:hypothetical protein